MPTRTTAQVAAGWLRTWKDGARPVADGKGFLTARTVPTTHPHGRDRPPGIGIGTPSPIPRTLSEPT